MGHLPGQQFRYAGRREGLCHPSGTRSRSWYSERCQGKPCLRGLYYLNSAIMEKIINPWEGMEGYFCFGCAPNNESGLKMEFYEDGDEIVSKWVPEARFQGWLNTLHGGIQATLLDEICAWVIARKLQTAGVTSRMENSIPENPFTRPTLTLPSKGKKSRSRKRNFVFIEAEIYNAQDEVCTKGRLHLFHFPKRKSRKGNVLQRLLYGKRKGIFINLTAKASFSDKYLLF